MKQLWREEPLAVERQQHKEQIERVEGGRLHFSAERVSCPSVGIPKGGRAPSRIATIQNWSHAYPWLRPS